ncbi:hypothetical protein [Salinirubrum litoreum]|uniref:Uncharacterized protein n=1 Tax=Salinirubrum litoreum TaxID=1126234 RepID=A0ABD5RA06_9EURY|nr:hypothetical protein [Salinirubrum litoreum]
MPSTSHRLAVVGLAVALVGTALLAGVPTTDARAPPTPLCGACSERLDESAERRGVDLTRGETDLVVQVHENGSTSWRATVELTAGGDALENETLRAEVVDSAVQRGVGDPTDVRSRLDGETLVVTHRDRNATSRHLGVVVFTHVVPDSPSVPWVIGGEGARYVGADRVTVEAPPGYRVTGGYEYATVSEDRVVWTGSDDGRRFIEGENQPTMLPDGSLFPNLRTTVARWLV